MPKEERVGSTLGYDRASGKGEGQVGIIRKDGRKEGFSSFERSESKQTLLRVNYRNVLRRRRRLLKTTLQKGSCFYTVS